MMKVFLENASLYLVLMSRSRRLGSEFKVFGSLQTQLLSGFALFTFQSQHNLSRCLCLLVKDRLGLPTESHLFTIVPTLSLCKVTGLSGLILCDLVNGVLLALAGTVGLALFRNIHHNNTAADITRGERRVH